LEREVELTYESTIILAVAATVLLSILAHGVSAVPGIKWYAKKVEYLDETAPELQDFLAVKPG
jgi:NhaP-type Na+/H+ or K+/H+ antiporter